MSHPFKPIDAFKSPRFSQIATFMRLPHHRTAADLDVAILGIPYDGGTSYRAGARFGPREIRSQSAMIRPWNPVLKVSPYEALKIADYGDIDISPVSIERTNEIVEQEIGGILAAGCMPGVGRRGPLDRAADPPRARPPARAGGAGPLRLPSRHLGPVLRLAVLPRDDVPPGGGGGAHRLPPHVPDRDPGAALRPRRLRLPGRARDDRGPRRGDQGAGGRLGRRAVREAPRGEGVRVLRHRRGRPGVRPRHRNAGGGRADRPTRRSRWSGGSAASTSWGSTWSRWRPSTTARARSPPFSRRTSSSSSSRWSRSTGDVHGPEEVDSDSARRASPAAAG